MQHNTHSDSDSDSEKDKVDPTICFVLYNDYEITDAGRLLSRYNDTCSSDMKAADLTLNNNTLSFSIDGETGIISFMPSPYPWKELEDACATSWMWKEASDVLKDHKRYIIISWMSASADKVHKNIVVSQLTASVLEEVNGQGVYWSDGALVNKKNVFCDMVSDIERNGLPLFLWVNFRIEKNPDSSLNMITNGLSAFGAMEVEIIKVKKPFNEIIEFGYQLVAHLIQNGNVIRDGETIGEDKEKKIVAHHRESVWRDSHRGLVLRVSV